MEWVEVGGVSIAVDSGLVCEMLALLKHTPSA